MGNRKVRKNRTGYIRAESTKGIMREHNEVINRLPPVGAHVIVRECTIHCKKDEESNLYTTYINHTQFRDVWNRPKELIVTGYTKGIENALDPMNKVCLEWTAPSGMIFKNELAVIPITTGSVCLVEVGETKEGKE